MAGTKGKSKAKRPVRHFFLNGELHSRVHVNQGLDRLWAWNHKKGKLDEYIWSWARKQLEPAYGTKQVANLLNRSHYTLHIYLQQEMIPPLQHLTPYVTPSGRKSKTTKKQWSKEDIFRMHDALAHRSLGRPRKDGVIKAMPMPSRVELSAMLRHDMILYVETSDGEFVPAWKEAEW